MQPPIFPMTAPPTTSPKKQIPSNNTMPLYLFLMGLLFTSVLTAEEKPLWDLSKNQISAELQLGKLQREGHHVILKNKGTAFAIPAKAFPDQNNFTVQVTARFPQLDKSEGKTITLMHKQDDKKSTEDNGFALKLYKHIWHGTLPVAQQEHVFKIFPAANKIVLNDKNLFRTKIEDKKTLFNFTMVMRDGKTSFYKDGILFNRILMPAIPNDEPMWIGHLDSENSPLATIITGVKVYGPTFKYVTNKKSRLDPSRGNVGGKGWTLDIPKNSDPTRLKVLIYGDSISSAYRQNLLPSLLKEQADLYHCAHYVSGEVPKKALQEMAGRFPFDIIIFNNGLHSLHWTPEKVSDELVYKRMQDLALCFKQGSPKAKVFYLLTTPFTKKGKPVTGLDPVNELIIRLNTISSKVMKDEGIEIIDIYSPLVKRLDLARGDKYHWNNAGAKLMSETILKKIMPTIKSQK